MVTNNTYYYGIKYKVVKLADDEFFLLPISLVGGLSDSYSFSTDHGSYAILRNKNSFTNKYVIGNVFYTDDLEKIYDYYDDTNTLGKYFFEDNREVILYAKTDKEGNIKIYKIDVGKYKRNIDKDSKATYYYENEDSFVKLNNAICNKLLSCESKEEMQKIIEMYKSNIGKFEEMKDDSITRIDTVNNKITSIGINKTVEQGYNDTYEVENQKNINISKNVSENEENDISLQGLYNAIRSNVFGHDKEIKIIARRLYRNHIAKDKRKIKSILITGPTGTGKTETIKAAASYLNAPYTYANTADLVPTGIVGPKIEDSLLDLVYKCGKDIKKAERGIFFLDEYDKIGNLEVKSAVKPSLLSFNGGEKIQLPVLGRGVTFDTSRLNRAYAGVFEKLEEKYKKLGFGNDTDEKNKILIGPAIKRAIIEKGYFTQEDLGRISTFIRFSPLDIETKKDILLHSNLSDLRDTINGYKEDFGVEIEVTDEFLEAFLNTIPEDEGMRDIGGYLDFLLDDVEEELCDAPKNKYKKLVLNKKIVDDHTNYDLF